MTGQLIEAGHMKEDSDEPAYSQGFALLSAIYPLPHRRHLTLLQTEQTQIRQLLKIKILSSIKPMEAAILNISLSSCKF